MDVTFDEACALLEGALQGAARQVIVDEASHASSFGHALAQLRHSMGSHGWKAGPQRIGLERLVRTYDSRTRREGFHVLHDWDGKADAVTSDTIPVDVLNFLIRERGGEAPDRRALAILLDYYFLHLLALMSLRVWDDGDADRNLDRLDGVLRDLQGANGSGQPFVDNAETLILIATAHYEPDERAFDRLLGRVRTLNAPHRSRVALGHAASMGCHLRFGFEATCGRDTVATRADNVADYPWLCFALSTLMTAYARMADEGDTGPQRDAMAEAMLNGLSADAGAFIGDHPPSSLAASEDERSAFRAGFRRHQAHLLEEWTRCRPSDHAYSPLCFYFNFSHNVLKGTVVDALLRGDPWRFSLNDLLTGVLRDEPPGESKETLALTLMGYARARPDRIGGRLMPAIVYDRQSGRQAFTAAMKKLRT